MTPQEELKKVKEILAIGRRTFEQDVDLACAEVIKMAKEVSPTIGEISVAEAKSAVISEFIKRLR